MPAVLHVSVYFHHLSYIETSCLNPGLIDDVLHGSSPKNPVHEIMVQGPQSKVIASHLQGLGVPKKMIQIDDKTNKKGKGKK